MRLSLSIIMLCFTFPCFSQKKNAKNIVQNDSLLVKGIGSFKINKTTILSIDSLIQNYDAQEIPMQFDKTSINYIIAPKIKEHRVFKIIRTSVSNLTFEDIYLDFTNDTLYSLTIRKLPYEFLDAMILKYGEPETKTKYTKITCRSKAIGEYGEEESESRAIFKSASNIMAYYFVNKYFDDNCEKQYMSYFLVQDTNKSIDIYKKEASIEEKLDKDEDARKRKAISDL